MNRWKTGITLMMSCLMFAACTEDNKDNGSTECTGADCKEECTGADCKQECTGPNCKEECTGADCKQECTGPNCKQECTGPNCNNSGAVISVSSLEPASGKADTLVTIKGKNLKDTEKVCFGSNCVAPETKNDTEVTAKAPAGNGSVYVSAVVNGSQYTAGQFTYLTESDNASEIDWCQLSWVNPSTLSGEAIQAYAQVYEEGKTGASSDHSGIQAQVGYARDTESDLAKFKWVDAKRNTEFTAAAETNDEYMADDLKLSDGSYNIVFRFSLDGTNWKYCDKDSKDGFSMDQVGHVDVTPAPIIKKTVSWCSIVSGETLDSKINEETDNIIAQAYVEGCTDGSTVCADLKGQVGYGSFAVADEESIEAGFTWVDASVNTNFDASSNNNDEFLAKLTGTAVGEYAIAYRFSVDGGESWKLCDAKSDSVYSANDTVKWTVLHEDGTRPGDEPGTTVDWCRVQYPENMTVRANRETDLIYGRAYVKNCTGHPYDKCNNLKAEVGYVPKNAEDPSVGTFVPATLNKDLMPASSNNEYSGKLTPTVDGEYAIVYRFSLDGTNWTYCDYDDDPGFDMSKTGTLTVEKDEDKIAWCRVQFPETQTIKAGKTTDKYYGRVYSPDCTEGEKHCESISAELGYGLKSSDISTFHFVKAEYNSEMTTGDQDEYEATLTVNEPGGYDVVYRFSSNGGKTWTLCDFDDKAGFKQENAASLIVKDDKLSVSWCRLMTDTVKVTTGGLTTEIRGQAFVDECTTNADRCSTLSAQVGYGTKDQKVEDFDYYIAQFDENFSTDDHNNDQYYANISAPKTPGEYELAFAFSLDGGLTYVYCDAADSEGFDRSKLGKLIVEEPPKPKVDWCQIQWPQDDIEIYDNESADVYGRVLVEGCTNIKGGCSKKLKAQVGYGDPSTNNLDNYHFVDAKLSTTGTNLGNNEEYVGTLKGIPAGEYAIAYRFSIDDGKTWTACDRDDYSSDSDDSIKAFDANKTIKLIVNELPPAEVTWCQMLFEDKDAASMTLKSNEETTIYGQAFVSKCTEADGPCDGLTAFLAYGKPGQQVKDYERIAATYDKNVVYNDQFKATLKIVNNNDGDEEYNVAYGFTIGNKTVYCDHEGGSTFNPDKAGKLTIKTAKRFITWCQMTVKDGKNSMTLKSGETSVDIYGQAFVSECTEADGKCDLLTAFAAYGKDDNLNSYKRVDATFVDNEGYNDRFKANLTITNDTDAVENYNVVYGFSLDNGSNITWCSLEGGTNNTEKPVKVAVKSSKKSISYCQMFLSNGQKEMTLESDEVSGKIYGQAYIEDCTEDAGACEGLKAFVEYSKAGENNYQSVNAAFEKQVNNNDEFAATIQIHNESESDEEYDLRFGFKLNNGENVYCDTEGLGTEHQAKVTVKTNKKAIGWCRVYPEGGNTITLESGAESNEIFGQAYIEGCTDQTEACENLSAFIAYGTADQSLKDFTYVDAEYSKKAGNDNHNEDYVGKVSIVNKTGEDVVYDLVYGFSLDNGKTITWCDGENGGENFDRANAVKVTVKPEPEPEPFMTWGGDNGQYMCGFPNVDDKNNHFSLNDYVEIVSSIYMNGCTNAQSCDKTVVSAALYYHVAKPADMKLNDKSWGKIEATKLEGKDLDNFSMRDPNARNNYNYSAILSFSRAMSYYYYFAFGIEDNATKASMMIQCLKGWKNPAEATVDDLGVVIYE